MGLWVMPGAAPPAQQVPEPQVGVPVEARVRLVQQQHRGVREHGQGQIQLGEGAAGEPVGALVGIPAEVQLLVQAPLRRGPLVPGHPVGDPEQLEVFVAREPLEHDRALRAVAEGPCTSTAPASADSAPTRICISVDFPEPFSPTRPTTSPGRIDSETPSSTWLRRRNCQNPCRYALEIPPAASTGAACTPEDGLPFRPIAPSLSPDDAESRRWSADPRRRSGGLQLGSARAGSPMAGPPERDDSSSPGSGPMRRL